MATGCLRVFSRGFYSHGRTGHIRTFELPARLVWVVGFEPTAFRTLTERSTKLSYTQIKMELWVGVEPTNNGFANHFPTDENPKHIGAGGGN